MKSPHLGHTVSLRCWRITPQLSHDCAVFVVICSSFFGVGRATRQVKRFEQVVGETVVRGLDVLGNAGVHFLDRVLFGVWFFAGEACKQVHVHTLLP